MAGLKALVGSLHKVEEYLAAVRAGEKSFSRDHLDLLNDLQDALEKIVRFSAFITERLSARRGGRGGRVFSFAPAR